METSLTMVQTDSDTLCDKMLNANDNATDITTASSPAGSVEAEIVNRLGLHARAAAKFVKTLAPYRADVMVHHQGQSVSGRSIMGLMMLAAGRGTKITLDATGPDAAQALEALTTLISGRFDEDD